MRRTLGKLTHQSIIGHTTGKSILLSSSSSFDFSTTAGNNGGGDGGSGRGRGRGSDFPKFSFVDSSSTPGKQTNHEDETSSSPSLIGHGHGRGKPLSSSPNTPPFSSIGPPPSGSGASRGTTVTTGRGRGTVVENPRAQSEEKSNPRKNPVFFRKDDDSEVNLPIKGPINVGEESEKNLEEKDHLPKTILSFLSGAGRGKPTQFTNNVDNENEKKVEEVNRHVKPRPPPVQSRGPPRPPPVQGARPVSASPKMSQEEAINKARGILFKDGDSGGGVESGGGEPRGMGARGGGGGGRGQRGGFVARGRGRGFGGGGRGRGGRGRGRGMSYRDDDDGEEEEEETAEDKANAEKLARFLGPEKMDLLVEAFEEASGSVLPSPEEDAHVDAMHTNLLLECEPEYLMAEFDSNPDIDEKPPISLEDALEKMKPFLMAYEDIKTDKEWRNVVEETMKNLPLMKELVEYYSGPGRATAKKQGEELERVAKTLPASTPSSVKRFTDRAVLSLKSNPGWGFDRKCQFMDKLAWEVSQSYK